MARCGICRTRCTKAKPCYCCRHPIRGHWRKLSNGKVRYIRPYRRARARR